MKKYSKIVFTLVLSMFIMTSVNAYAKDSWFLLGYNYTLPDKGAENLNGPATLTMGSDIFAFIGFELALGTRWNDTGKHFLNSDANLSANSTLWSFDIKPYLMLQPKIGFDALALRPYLGIGPTFSFSGQEYTSLTTGGKKSSATYFDVGVSTKAGLRIQALKFLLIGVGAEYIYHDTKHAGKNINMSGFTFGGEIGFIW